MGLTIIIAALNEGDEPLKTIKGIYDTAKLDDVEIILFNDGSEEWTELPKKYKGVRVISHEQRMGLPYCRDRGVELAKHENVAFFNARMRFYDDKWLPRMMELLKHNVKTLYCTTSVLEWDGEKPSELPDKIYGADIRFCQSTKNGNNILAPSWKTAKPQDDISEVPCVLGANYFVNKAWYNYILGFKGLCSYGGSEAFLSLKSWMAGGKCEVVSDIEIGNVYRDRKGYSDNIEDFLWNKIYTAFTLLSYKDSNKLLDKIYERNCNPILTIRLIRNLEELHKDRAYYSQIKVLSINNLIIR
jgi:glycosyltransferase involved in cell wall biosynthesis